MDRAAGPTLRWVRGCLLAVVSVGLAVGAHTSAGGAAPGPAPLVTAFALCAGVSAALLGRPASAVRVALLLVAGQAFVHGFLTVTSGREGTASTAGHGGATAMSSTSPSAMGGMAAPSSQMVLAHLVAAAGVGLWLALGERALWTVLGLAADGVRDLLRDARTARFEPLPVTPLPLALRTRGPATVPDRSVHLLRQQAVLRRSVARRGPPVFRSA